MLVALYTPVLDLKDLSCKGINFAAGPWIFFLNWISWEVAPYIYDTIRILALGR